jgi:hypothetical protein
VLSWSPERASAGSQRLWLDRYATVAISCSVRCRPVAFTPMSISSWCSRRVTHTDPSAQATAPNTASAGQRSPDRDIRVASPEQANAVPEADPPAAPDLGVRDRSGLCRTAFCQLCAEVAQLPALEPGVVPGSCDAGEGTERPVKHSRDQGVDEFQFPCIVQL